MKKILFTTIMFLLLVSCVDKEQMKKEILADLVNELEHPHFEKGDGSNFYNEPVSIGGDVFYIHHSTLQCPEINHGVQRNWFKKQEFHNIFCSECMDDELITKFHNTNFP